MSLGFLLYEVFGSGSCRIISTVQLGGVLIFFSQVFPIETRKNIPAIWAPDFSARFTSALWVSPERIMSSTIRMLSLLVRVPFGR